MYLIYDFYIYILNRVKLLKKIGVIDEYCLQIYPVRQKEIVKLPGSAWKGGR